MIQLPYSRNSLWWKPIFLMVFGLPGYIYNLKKTFEIRGHWCQLPSEDIAATQMMSLIHPNMENRRSGAISGSRTEQTLMMPDKSSRNSCSKKNPQSWSIQDSGGNGDCAYRALAAALAQTSQTQGKRLSETVVVREASNLRILTKETFKTSKSDEKKCVFFSSKNPTMPLVIPQTCPEFRGVSRTGTLLQSQATKKKALTKLWGYKKTDLFLSHSNLLARSCETKKLNQPMANL